MRKENCMTKVRSNLTMLAIVSLLFGVLPGNLPAPALAASVYVAAPHYLNGPGCKDQQIRLAIVDNFRVSIYHNIFKLIPEDFTWKTFETSAKNNTVRIGKKPWEHYAYTSADSEQIEITEFAIIGGKITPLDLFVSYFPITNAPTPSFTWIDYSLVENRENTVRKVYSLPQILFHWFDY